MTEHYGLYAYRRAPWWLRLLRWIAKPRPWR